MRNTSKIPRKRSSPFYSGESDGLQAGDGIGNRQKFSETRISADDIGNRLPASELHNIVRDDIGNSIAGAPTHQQSGVLAGFEGRGRRRREPNETRGSSYAVGGVNPLVSGSQALLSMFSTKEEEPNEEAPRARPSASVIEPSSVVRSETQDPRRPPRKADKGDSSDRWLKRLLEFDDEAQETPSQGDPKQKAIQARLVLSEIFEKSGVMAAIGTEIISDPTGGRPSVLVSFEDIDLSVDVNCRLSKVFAQDSLALLALNFLVNKIVNRVPEDRVRVQVSLRKQASKGDEDLKGSEG